MVAQKPEAQIDPEEQTPSLVCLRERSVTSESPASLASGTTSFLGLLFGCEERMECIAGSEMEWMLAVLFFRFCWEWLPVIKIHLNKLF